MRYIRILGCVAWLLGLGPCNGEAAAGQVSSSSTSPGFCTNMSLGFPGWKMTGLEMSEDSIHFQLFNNARPDINITCDGKLTMPIRGQHECSDPGAGFVYDGESAVLGIKQHWTCDDTGLAFVGIGNTTLDCASTGPCQGPESSLAIRGSLLAPVAISPAEPVPPPPGAGKAGCTRATREAPAWNVSNLVYVRQIAAFCVSVGPVAPPCYNNNGWHQGKYEFDLVNTVTGDTRHCLADSLWWTDVDVNDTDWINCDWGSNIIRLPSLPRPLARQYDTLPYFRVKHDTNTLELNQTWYCNDMGEGQEYNFTVIGSVSPAFDPSIQYAGNLSLGSLTINGSAPTLRVPGNVVEEHRLAPHTLEQPAAFGRSCTAGSLLRPDHFTVRDYNYWNDTDKWFVSMWVTNPIFVDGSDRGERMCNSDGLPALDPAEWYPCHDAEWHPGPNLVALNRSFSLDTAQGRLLLQEQWVCADDDQAHPILFTAMATTTSSKKCTTWTQPNSRYTRCDGTDPFDMPVTDFSWRACKPEDQCPTAGSGFNWEWQYL